MIKSRRTLEALRLLEGGGDREAILKHYMAGGSNRHGARNAYNALIRRGYIDRNGAVTIKGRAVLHDEAQQRQPRKQLADDVRRERDRFRKQLKRMRKTTQAIIEFAKRPRAAPQFTIEDQDAVQLNDMERAMLMAYRGRGNIWRTMRLVAQQQKMSNTEAERLFFTLRDKRLIIVDLVDHVAFLSWLGQKSLEAKREIVC